MQLPENIWNNKNLFKVLKNNGIVIAPTDTIYGILGKALSEKAVSRIYTARKRNPQKPSIILIDNMNELKKFSIILSDKQKNKLKKYWNLAEKPTSIILDCSDESLAYLHRGTKTLAFRLPALKSFQNLLAVTGPLIAPSANPEALPPAQNISEAEKYFGNSVDLYVDGGVISGRASKVIKLHKDGSVSILRE